MRGQVQDDAELSWLWQELAVSQREARMRAPAAIRTAIVLGGGTAGYLSALILRRVLPRARVTVIESPNVPIIGVGEATIPSIIPFLHRRLGIDAHEMFRYVQPTWKLGIRFEWGKPEPGYYFNAPFDWDKDSIGLLGSLAATGNINEATFQSMLMDANRVPIARLPDGRYVSLVSRSPIAYHLDNKRFVQYLRMIIDRRAIERLETTVHDVLLHTDGRDGVQALVSDGGVRHEADLFIDCSGFHSRLIEKALGVPFVPFDASLFTNRALVFNLDHGGEIKPYTTARTMDAGWVWNTPQVENDHCGYVYCDAFTSHDAAADEVERTFGPVEGTLAKVFFRAGCTSRAWVGNTVAIGNSQGFVEPLESSGLLMITTALDLMVDALAGYPDNQGVIECFNRRIAKLWDGLRWFLAMHYKFNRRLDTPFWRHAREDTDVSGAADTLELYKNSSPLRYRDKGLMYQAPHFYGVAGTDTILLGQGVASTMMADPDVAGWTRRRDRAAALVRSAITMADAVRLDDLEEYLPSARRLETPAQAPVAVAV
jgi:tryptophan 7-halogenase